MRKLFFCLLHLNGRGRYFRNLAESVNFYYENDEFNCQVENLCKFQNDAGLSERIIGSNVNLD
jgi:hypothetical protein